MKQAAITMYLSLFLWLLWGCSKNDAPVTPPVTPPKDSSTIQYGTPYNKVPDREDVVLYQVNIRTFSAGGNLAGVTAGLDSIKALGVNTIYLMPVFPVGQVKAVNSPYCVKDYLSVNPEFGTLTDLRQLVEKAHSKGLAVILDWVENHTAWDNAWITSHKDWYKQDAAGNIISPPNTGWNDVAQLDFSNYAMRAEMIRCMKYWVYNANIDGFRCDYADGPPIDFWTQAIDTLRKISTHKLLLMAEGSRAANFSVGFDYNFGFGYFGNLKKIYKDHYKASSIDSMNTVEYTNAGPTQRVVRYLTNHDVNGSDGTPAELFDGERGAMAAFVATAFMKSIPMIYNGQEVGTPYRLVFPFTEKNIDWTLHPEIKAEYKQLLAVYNNMPALRKGTITSYNGQDIIAFVKTLGTTQVLVLCNLRNSNAAFTTPATLQGSNWKNAFDNNTVSLATTMNLSPYEYRVLVNM